jgi:hypothetical protein
MLYIEEFRGAVACDIHMDFVDGTDVLIVRYNPTSVEYGGEYFDAKLVIGQHYSHNSGFIICGFSDFDRDIRDFCYL